MQLRMSATYPAKTCAAQETTMTNIGREELVAPKVVDRSTFQAELDALRIREKAHTREGDAIAAARRLLPMVAVDGATPLIGEHGAVTLFDAFEGRRMLIAYYFMCTPAILRRSSARGARGLLRRSASCPIFILATSPTPRSARVRTKRAPGTANSWVGRCLGTRPRGNPSRLSWFRAGLEGCTSSATCGKDPRFSKLTGRRHAVSK
jgi:hypothetical protein